MSERTCIKICANCDTPDETCRHGLDRELTKRQIQSEKEADLKQQVQAFVDHSAEPASTVSVLSVHHNGHDIMVGQTYDWEPYRPRAYARLTVEEIISYLADSQETIIRTIDRRGDVKWNKLGHFVEAVWGAESDEQDHEQDDMEINTDFVEDFKARFVLVQKALNSWWAEYGPAITAISADCNSWWAKYGHMITAINTDFDFEQAINTGRDDKQHEQETHTCDSKCASCADYDGTRNICLVIESGTKLEFTDYETIDHPPHYNDHPSGVECIDIIEHFPYNTGAAVKYIWRAGLKPDIDAIEDLKKASWYIEREIKRILSKPEEEDPC